MFQINFRRSPLPLTPFASLVQGMPRTVLLLGSGGEVLAPISNAADHVLERTISHFFTGYFVLSPILFLVFSLG